MLHRGFQSLEILHGKARAIPNEAGEAHVNNSKSVYRRFVELEEKAAEVYLRFASRFKSNRMLSAFWFDMAMDEKQHAGLLQFCLAELLFASDLPDKAELKRLTALFKELEKRAADPNLTVDEAFTLAIELERSQMNAIYCRLTTSVHTSAYLVKRKIATFVPNHVDSLLAAARKFGATAKVLKDADRLKKSCA
jgi:rubrerythrin